VSGAHASSLARSLSLSLSHAPREDCRGPPERVREWGPSRSHVPESADFLPFGCPKKAGADVPKRYTRWRVALVAAAKLQSHGERLDVLQGSRPCKLPGSYKKEKPAADVRYNTLSEFVGKATGQGN